ncbi:hypothetical protein AAP_03117 [Ascosphaera apis ARSEF 7405]|uniref:Uncharacterized protein n=1 Tax=Ascosphaera apis ARSEF 7405 TaxID=392613 RepID=A0A167YXY5_9EURO|nr:hypothetical protein AAP_03117 [Ascosphaera apis ARSEF 7405]
MDIHPQEQNPPDEDSSSPAQERSTSTVQAATPAISTAISTTENAVSFAGAVTAYPSDYQLAGLIEAAAAAGQDLTWNHAQDTAVSVGNEQIPVLSGNAHAHAQTQTERFVPSMPVDSALASRSSIPPMQEQVFDLQNGLQETSAAAEAQLQNQAGQQQSQNLATSPANTRKRKRTSTVAGTEASSNQNIDPAIMVPNSQAAQYTGVATQYVGVTPSPGGTENPPFSIVEPDPNYRPLTPPRPLHDFRPLVYILLLHFSENQPIKNILVHLWQTCILR